MRDIVLIGAGGHAASCIDVIESEGRFRIAGLVGMESELHQRLCGYEVIATDDTLSELAKEYRCALITVGQIKSCESRLRLYRQACAAGFEMPVIVPLTEGSWYQFVFIGDYTSRLYEVRMFDWNERQVIFQQKKWGDIDGNIISYSYIPKFSEFHMMKPVQVNKQKKKNLCGYVMLFKKANPNTQQTGSVAP